MPLEHIHEVLHRLNAGVEVWLLWYGGTDQTFIRLDWDGHSATFPVPKHQAKEAYEHPFVHLPACEN